MGRNTSILLLTVLLFWSGCTKEVPPPQIDTDTPVATPPPQAPKKEPPVIVEEVDIAPFIRHFPEVDRITARYNDRIDQETGRTEGLMRKGQAEIAVYLKEQDIERRLFMRKAAKIIRGWIGLKILKDPAVRDKKLADTYLRLLSPQEKEIIERNFDLLETVLKDIPTGY